MYSIYKHTAPNGKVYIGQTRQTPERRWRNGEGYSKNPHFYRAIQKFGWNMFAHEIVAECETLKEANVLEAQLINKYNSNDPTYGYNITGGADGKCVVAESTKQLLSQKRKGRFAGDKNPNYGRKHTEEERRKISEHNKGLFLGEKSPLYGKLKTPEQRQRMSEGRRNSKAAQDFIRQLNAAKAKRVLCVETGVVYVSAHEAARQTGFGQGNISAACRGEYKKAYGFQWKYL